jgi:two-component system response regulator BaeR
MPTILVVEDEEKIAGLLKDYLNSAGYCVDVLARGDLAVEYTRKSPPDLILLDLMLPVLDGMEACRRIRAFSLVPIIMITARVEEIDRIVGLELGADDYICKPFSPREVVARVKAVLRRMQRKVDEQPLAAGPVVLDPATYKVTVQDRPLDHLTPTEFALLRVMMSGPGRVFTRNELIEQVQGYTYEGYDRTIDTHIKNLRRKLNDILPGSDMIKTVYGIGYKFDHF